MIIFYFPAYRNICFLQCREANLEFNIKKTQSAPVSDNYLCHALSDKSIEPDPKKIKEFAKQWREDSQRFLGTVEYLAKFTRHLSRSTCVLRQLLKKNFAWIWDENT